ncbi:hypothetical protein [Paracidovorax avenae]|uniref:hypothetical protein n=1 Tax=Paracidovorax avenae TaxID=80867 RepID=UPI0012602AB0|nr:hypothetical protein [Paracidovorax avenae]
MRPECAEGPLHAPNLPAERALSAGNQADLAHREKSTRFIRPRGAGKGFCRPSLKRAYLVTIFGYSAPKTDVEAIALIKDAWGTIEERNLEDFEFIDICDEDSLIASWQEFIHSHHYQVHKDFFSSSLAQHPRRTTVELFDRTMNCMFTEALQKFIPGMTWENVESLINELVEEERGLSAEEFLITHSA